MASYKIWYIVALGIVALGLNNSLIQNRTSFADRLAAIGQRVFMSGHDVNRAPAPQFAQVQVAVARHQAEFARMQAELARAEAQRAAAMAVERCQRIAASQPLPEN